MFVHELIYQGKPDSLAIVDHERRITYRELQQHVAACRDRLYAAGVRVGDRVSIFSRNSADYVYAYMAIVSLGAIAVPINFQLSSREIAYIIKDSGSRHILTYQPLNLVDALSTLRCDMRVTQHDIRQMGKKDESLPAAPTLPPTFDEQNPCVIIYTSGTTGSPKGAVLSHRNLITNAAQMSIMGSTAAHHVLCVLPMYHCFFWFCFVFFLFFCGVEVVFFVFFF